MEREGFKFLDKFEERLWKVLEKAQIKFRVNATSYVDYVQKKVVKTPDMHHYEFDDFYDAMTPHYMSSGAFSQMFHDSVADRYVESFMPNLNIQLADPQKQAYHMDTLDKLADLEAKGEELEKELSIMGEKVSAYFYDANKVVNEAQNVTCDWNVLAGLKCQKHIDVLKQIGARFDEKIAALRFQLSENKVQGILDELEKKYQAASEYASKVFEEIKKLA